MLVNRIALIAPMASTIWIAARRDPESLVIAAWSAEFRGGPAEGGSRASGQRASLMRGCAANLIESVLSKVREPEAKGNR